MTAPSADRQSTPFADSPARAAHAPAAPSAALAGDWTEGLRGPRRPLALPRPRRLGAHAGAAPRNRDARAEALAKTPPPSESARPAAAGSPGPDEAPAVNTEQLDLKALEELGAQAEPPISAEVEAPEAWASAQADELASVPPPVRAPPGETSSAAAGSPAHEEVLLLSEALPDEPAADAPAEPFGLSAPLAQEAFLAERELFTAEGASTPASSDVAWEAAAPSLEPASSWTPPLAPGEPRAVEPTAWESAAPAASAPAEWAAAPVQELIRPSIASAPSGPAHQAWGAQEASWPAANDDAAAPALGEGESPFAPLAPGSILSGEDELAPHEPVAEPIPLEDPEMLVPLDDAAHAAAAMQLVGEHRVAVQTRGGQTRRGFLRDADLSAPTLALHPSPSAEPEPLASLDVKAIFFMLSPGERGEAGRGARVRITFEDGRSIEGNRDGAEGPAGFFLVPSDAARTNTRRIYVARAALREVLDS